jgi:hypothetical protein
MVDRMAKGFLDAFDKRFRAVLDNRVGKAAGTFLKA